MKQATTPCKGAAGTRGSSFCGVFSPLWLQKSYSPRVLAAGRRGSSLLGSFRACKGAADTRVVAFLDPSGLKIPKNVTPPRGLLDSLRMRSTHEFVPLSRLEKSIAARLNDPKSVLSNMF